MYYSELQRMQKLLLQIIETYILSQKKHCSVEFCNIPINIRIHALTSSLMNRYGAMKQEIHKKEYAGHRNLQL